ncbi:hypothetical protein ACSCBZ_03985 [Streptomyces niveiscabiei]|uniref:hypothetical protein n=1 Tax=Streptomyces niveiscabiei TaxID=164115 RepID=UPI003EC095AC
MGEVTLQQRTVDASETVDADVRQEAAEADQSVQSGVCRGDAQPAGQPKPKPPFNQVTQPRLTDAFEVQADARPGDGGGGRSGDARQPLQPPHISRILALPARAVAQDLDGVPDLDQEHHRFTDPARGRGLPPLPFGDVEQGGHTDGSGEPDGLRHDARWGRAAVGVGPALQPVLKLQRQLTGQVSQIDVGGAGQLGVHGEPFGIRTPDVRPPLVVTAAEQHLRALRPQGAERQAALGRGVTVLHQIRRIPQIQAGPSGSAPPLVVLGAVALAEVPVAATGDLADRQGLPPANGPAGIGEDLLHRRAAAVPPADHVPVAEPAHADNAVTVGNGAGRGDEDGVARGRAVDLGAELCPDRGQELSQQPGMTRANACGGESHSWTSRPVNQPAFSRVRRASSTVR